MKKKKERIILTIILLVAAVSLYYGWKLFYFMTDDALIAFRYISNSIIGYGYTWNPPPFRPVEGYTSFLWIVMLDIVWRFFGMLPTQSSNYLSLFFSYMSLVLIAIIVMRMKLAQSLSNSKLLFLSLIILATLINRTFLAWTSSGLETALFNFLVTLWIYLVLFNVKSDNRWIFGITGSATLIYLSRPDGILFAGITALMAAIQLLAARKRGNLSQKKLWAISPLTIIIIHFAWRRMTYGEWLPNTYYAKHLAAWPEAGVRYFASFMLEYALWVWFILLLILIIIRLKNPRRGLSDVVHRLLKSSNLNKAASLVHLSRPLLLTLVSATIFIHIGYYTLIIGGDHFEYRVYSYLIPLIFLSFLWMLNSINARRSVAIGLFCLFVLLSCPIQWTHWAMTKDLNSRKKTHMMKIPIQPAFPFVFQWYAGAFDKTQFWLIDHHVCMRHQEHKVLHLWLKKGLPSRAEGELLRDPDHPIMSANTVGIAGWVFPHIAIIDIFGLNDYVIARNKTINKQERAMAHDREPPEGYIQSFVPNVYKTEDNQYRIARRKERMTAGKIRAIEEYWIQKIVHGIDVGMP
jgi:arabinofuranosyltransferase